MTPDPSQPETLAAPEAPLTLAMPEPIKPIKETDAASAMGPLNQETRSAAVAQADQFISDLLKMDVTSGDFRARVDSAFRLGRKEIGDSALLTGKFMEKNYVSDADNPAFKVSSAAIEGLLASTARMFGDHVDRIVHFQSNPLTGVQALKASFDTVLAGLDKMNEFRSKRIESMGANITVLKGILAEGEAHMKREQTAVKAISEATTSAPAGPVSL